MNIAENDNFSIFWIGCANNSCTNSENYTQGWEEVLVHGVGVTITCLFGMIGNFLSIMVLLKPDMRSSMDCLLLGLTLCDTVLCVCSFFIFGLNTILKNLTMDRGIFYSFTGKFLYPIGLTAQSGSVFFTVIVTVERYIAVCKPLQSRVLCTWKRAKFYSTVVVIFASLYNIPRWMEYCINVCWTNGYNHYSLHDSEIRRNNQYITYYVNWSYLLIMYLIPFSILLILNVAICRQIRRYNKMRHEMTVSEPESRDISLEVLLFWVVATFVLCNILALVINVLDMLQISYFEKIIPFSNLLITLNSSINCVFYCLFGNRFRVQFIKLLPNRWTRRRKSDRSVSGVSDCTIQSTDRTAHKKQFKNAATSVKVMMKIMPDTVAASVDTLVSEVSRDSEENEITLGNGDCIDNGQK